MDPTLHTAWLAVGYAALARDETPAARRAFEQGAALEPRDPRPHVGMISEHGREDRAMDALAKVQGLIADLGDDCPAGVVGLRAKIQHARGLDREAEADLSAGLERAPDDVDLLLWRGIVRHNLGDRAGSEQDLRRAYALDAEHFARILRGSCPPAMARRILDVVEGR